MSVPSVLTSASLPRQPRSEAPPSAAIYGCAGTSLTDAEKVFFAAADPLGFILFARNVTNPEQVRGLVAELRATVQRPDAPVLIDQEGGRVARLKPPHWRTAPPAGVIGALAERDVDTACEAAWLNMRLIGGELWDLGITVDCAPVCDVPAPGSHDIVGDRAFSGDPARVATVARAAALGLIDAGVLPVIKHMPGHGRAGADSHAELPTVDAALEDLRRSDFVPFRALADMPWAMTAHVLYTALDVERPATTSPTIIRDIIRGEIGFSGLLISDDLSMKALKGGFAERASAAIAAGCDVALHCNGDMDEMKAIASAVPLMSAEAIARFDRGEAVRRSSLQDGDSAKLQARFELLLSDGRLAS